MRNLYSKVKSKYELRSCQENTYIMRIYQNQKKLKNAPNIKEWLQKFQEEPN